MDTFTNPVMKENTPKKKLVLIGAGHSHLYVLKKLITSPLKDYNIFLITNHPFSTYSGMIPGAIVGQYSDYRLDIRPLAHLAGVTFIQAEAKSINPVTQYIELSKGYPPNKYDICSVNIGSTVSVDIPRDNSPLIPTRPINNFIPTLEKTISKINPKDEIKLTIVGSGIAGIELAFCTQERLKKICNKNLIINIIDKSPNPFQTSQFTKILKKEFQDRHIQLFTEYKPESIKNNTLFLKKLTPCLKKDTLKKAEQNIENKKQKELQNTKENNDYLNIPFDILIWATGATPPDFLLNSNLPKNKQEFASVNTFLQSIGHENLFFSGDCCHFEHPLPKAGVYAVRQGPILFENLKRMTIEKPLRPFKPQKDFLQLVNLGNGKAIAQKFGFTGKSSLFWKLKNSIDKKFISEFQVLNSKGELTDKFKAMSLQTMDMPCGGCASKLSAQSLYKVLKNTKKEDVAISPLDKNSLSNTHKATEKLSLVSNIDGFKPFHKDLFLVAQVATLNALSDFWAKGLTPVQGLASIHLEETQVLELSWIMEGIKNIFSQHSVHFAGGHTTVGLETLLNISVNGIIEPSQRWMSFNNIKSDLDLILTKPLGTGVLLYLDMRGYLPSNWAAPLRESLLLPNKTASDIALQYNVPTATDITGFGLAGHLLEMIENKDLSIEIHFENLPLLDGAGISLKRGYRSTFHPHNLHFKKQIQTHRKDIDILFDPQTSGGLVLAAEPDQTQNILKGLKESGHRAKVIGVTKPYQDSKIIVI